MSSSQLGFPGGDVLLQVAACAAESNAFAGAHELTRLAALLERIDLDPARLAWIDATRLSGDLHAIRRRLRRSETRGAPDRSQCRALEHRLAGLLAALVTRSDAHFASDRDRLRAGGLRGAELIAWIAEYPPEQREMALEHLLDVAQRPLDAPELPPELIGYIPSGIAPIVQAIRNIPIGPDDLFVDIGSGLGKVTLAVHLLSGARIRGIERDAELLAAAERSRAQLGLAEVAHELGDARVADFSGATVIFLYLPFTGASLAATLQRIEATARRQSLVVCSLGLDLGGYRWLQERETHDLWLSIYDSCLPGALPRVSTAPQWLGAAAEAVATERTLHDDERASVRRASAPPPAVLA